MEEEKRIDEENVVSVDEVVNDFIEEDLAPNIDDERILTEEDKKQTAFEEHSHIQL